MAAEWGWGNPLSLHRKVISDKYKQCADLTDIWSTYPTASEDPKRVKQCAGVLCSQIKAWGDLHLGKSGESFHDSDWLRGDWLRRTQARLARQATWIQTIRLRSVTYFPLETNGVLCRSVDAAVWKRAEARILPKTHLALVTWAD